MIEVYIKASKKHLKNYRKESRKYNYFSIFRLILILLFLVSLIFYIKNQQLWVMAFSFACFFSFLVLVKHHFKIARKKNIHKVIMTINNEEIDFLTKGRKPFDSGKEFTNSKHFYSYDLDIFGENSLFQYLNRTATHIGKQTLADRLKKTLSKELIKVNQEAINELKFDVEWRQYIYAVGKLVNDNSEKYKQLILWANKKDKFVQKTTLFLAYFVPILFFLSVAIQSFTTIDISYKVSVFLFVLNVVLTLRYSKKIKSVLIESDKIEELLKNYSFVLTEIENKTFKNGYLKELQISLLHQQKSSEEIQKLSVLFGNMSSFLNIFGSTIFNGLFQYHIHNFQKIVHWKRKNATEIKKWLQVIGEFEALNSLANFSYNNPQFCFPELTEDNVVFLKGVGHPLIQNEKRITNDISFKKQPFVILTGSNMSGKSTFLRALGVNLVLAKAGSVICAKQAAIRPMDLLVFMRLDDSLSENESYFFAEIKRLKMISEISKQKPCFILLDEMLKGTNSNDKRNGTVQFIKKMISHKAVGVIATHDLEVCNLTNHFPNYLVNNYFEVEIIDEKLHFDYKLRNGVCANQSASFLMKKMKIV